MNKRIKLKKRIFEKRCGTNCGYYNAIVNEKLITNNCCIGCNHKHNSDYIVSMNCVERGAIQINFE